MNLFFFTKRILLFYLLMTGIFQSTYAQNFSKSRQKQGVTADKKFLQSQWWLGVRGGLNLTQATPTTRYTSFSPTTGLSSDIYNKQYESFGILGGQAGIEVTYVYKSLAFSFQPNYRRQNFNYKNSYNWTDAANPSNVFLLNYEQTQRLDYFEFPLLVKYDLTKQDFRPFIQAGAFYGLLTNADKSVKISKTDNASGSKNEYTDNEFTTNVTDLFLTSSLGLIGGAGLSWDVGNIRLVFDVNYRWGLRNIANKTNRSSNNQLNDTGDAFDDIKINNLSFNLGCLFPLRFLSSQYYQAAD